MWQVAAMLDSIVLEGMRYIKHRRNSEIGNIFELLLLFLFLSI